MHRIRLFFIITSFSAGGGSEALLTSIVNALDDTGKYEIGIMEIIHNYKKDEPIHASIKIYPYYVEADALNRKERMYYIYHEWDSVISEYIPDDYDIYISFSYLRASFLLPRGKKCISWIHGDLYNLINLYPGARDMSEECELQREAFAKAQKIVAISDKTRKSIEDIFPEYRSKIHTIYNGVDTYSIIEKSKEATDVVLKKPAILYIGRLEQGKDPLRTLTIFSQLCQHRKDAHLYYLGYGDLAESVVEESKKIGIVEFVHMLGYHDNPFPIIRQADVVIMTSRSEGFPMSLLESVALGVPFVSTDVGGSKELSKCNSCGKVYVNNQEAVEAILDYLSANKDELKINAKNAMRQFGMKRYISEIENLIQEVLKN